MTQPRGAAPFADLTRPALFVIDPQRVFCDPTSPAYVADWETAGPVALDLARHFLRCGHPVVLTRHVHPKRDAGGTVGRFFGRLLTDADPLAAWSPPFREWIDTSPTSGVTLLTKARFSALTNLEAWVDLRGRDAIVIVGVQTHLCVTATAIDAAQYDVVPIVVRDATAARTAALHTAALTVLESGHAHVATAAAVRDTFCP